jgi:ligand-binding SRPBCC domain-containing protein
METIRLSTWMNAPLERCFRLSLSIDLHVTSASSTGERAIRGVTSGLIGEGETVTFQGRHFGLPWRHTSRIEALRPYSYFRDVMVAGPFHRFEHDHHFAVMNDGTRTRDEIRFSAHGGVLGRFAAKTFVRKHLVAFLLERNAVIKRVAESEEWRRYLENGGSRATAPVRDTARRWDGNALLGGSPAMVATRRPRG